MRTGIPLVFGVLVSTMVNGSVLQSGAFAAADSSQKVANVQLAAFKNDTGSILVSNPIGGVQLSSAVKDLVLADSASVADMIALLSKANIPQISGIGFGMGLAVKLLKESTSQDDRKAAESIAIQVAQSGNQALLEAFNKGVSGLQTLAVNVVPTNSPGAGGGAVGGAINGNGSQSQGTTNAPSPESLFTLNTTPTYSFSGRSSVSFTTGGTTTTCTISVSPVHTC